MEPFRPAVPVARTNKSLREMAQYHKISLKELKRQLNELDKEVNLFINDVYQVDVRRVDPIKGWPEIIWLSIKRRDRAPVGEERFRDFQTIKNMLIGEEVEAVELYPSESRLVDTCNQYHLWVVNGRFPFGFTTRAVSYEDMAGVVQKPL
jgi:hypothetical protein